MAQNLLNCSYWHIILFQKGSSRMPECMKGEMLNLRLLAQGRHQPFAVPIGAFYHATYCSAEVSVPENPRLARIFVQGSQQNRLARSPVSLEVGSNRGMCVTDVQLSHADPIIVEEAAEKE